MKRQSFITLLAAILLLGLLAGCSGNGAGDTAGLEDPVKASTKLDRPPQEKQILSDVNQSKYVELPSGSIFTSCEIIKWQSNTESKEDIVYCALTAQNSFYRSERQYRLLYNFYDGGGWILDGATAENKNEWTEAYLDTAGNDILGDMLWLNVFTPERLK